MALCVYAGRNLRRKARFTASASVILPELADLEGKRGELVNHHPRGERPPEKSEHRRRNGTATSRRLLTNPIAVCARFWKGPFDTPEICSLVASRNGRAVIRSRNSTNTSTSNVHPPDRSPVTHASCRLFLVYDLQIFCLPDNYLDAFSAGRRRDANCNRLGRLMKSVLTAAPKNSDRTDSRDRGFIAKYSRLKSEECNN